MLDFLNKKLDSWCFFLVEQTVADNSAGYGQSCTIGSNQCISSVGLVCSGGLCGCSSPYSWNTATSTCKRKFSKNFSNEKLFILGTLLTYNQACSTNSQCNSSLGLNCTNSVCQCDGFHAWNSANNSCEWFCWFWKWKLNDRLFLNRCVYSNGQFVIWCNMFSWCITMQFNSWFDLYRQLYMSEFENMECNRLCLSSWNIFECNKSLWYDFSNLLLLFALMFLI